MRVLLDTCVLSELYKPEPLVAVYESVNNVPDEHLFISVITLGEIGKGIALLPDGQRKQALLKWLTNIEYEYSERLLPINAETAAIWGKITAKTQQEGYVIHASNHLVVETALKDGLHIMNRNVNGVEANNVILINPWIKG